MQPAGLAALVFIVKLVFENVEGTEAIVAVFGAIGAPVAAVVGAVIGNTAGKATGERNTKNEIKAKTAQMEPDEARTYLLSL